MVVNFQFLIKGYVRKIPQIPYSCFSPFNSSLKDTEPYKTGETKHYISFQFLIKGYANIY